MNFKVILSKFMVLALGWLFLSGDSLRTGATSLRNGIHLYGQSPFAEQIGQEYLVFIVKEDKLVGAIYLPSSEFSCFRGTINGGVVNLAILDPYDSATYSHSIALKPASPLAANSSVGQGMGLEGYYPIDKIGDNDRRILRTCLSRFGGGR